jgi:hypothetical protein
MIAITFDTDHMTPDGLRHFLDEVLPPDVKATFFCYRPFACLTGTRHEIAVHPYLAGSPDWMATTRELVAAVEDENGVRVRGLRPHSLMSSQNYVVQLNGAGIEYVSTVCSPPDLETEAFRYPWGPVEIPIRYMDNMDLWARDKTGLTQECFSPAHIKNAVSATGMYCFDFHPIHILLNTSKFSDYDEWTRSGRPELRSCVGDDRYGVRNYFLDLCREIRKAKAELQLCVDLASRLRDTPA